MNFELIEQIMKKASGICLRKPMTSSEYELLLIELTWEEAIKKAEQIFKEIYTGDSLPKQDFLKRLNAELEKE